MEEQVQTQEQQQSQQAPDNAFTQKMQNLFFGEADQSVNNGSEQAQQQQSNEQQQQAAAPAPKKEDDAKIVDPIAWFKEEFKDHGWEDISKAKAEISEWKKAKETPGQPEIKFDNEESKKLYEAVSKGDRKEVYKILDKQQRLEELTSGEVTESNAAAIVKMAIKNKYSEFSDNDVERKFNKQFGLPKEPVQKADELDDDFAARKEEWAEKVKEIKEDLLLEAKIAKPELETLKSKLVLPDISPKESQRQEPTPEDLEKAKKFKDSFLATASDSIKNFNGFSITVEDKDVKIPISYGLSTEEKSVIEKEISKFAEQGFNTNEFFAERWVSEDGTLKTGAMIEDLSRLYFFDKVAQKFATDSANQRLEMFLKEKKNINLNEQQQFRTQPLEQKTPSEKMQEAFWGN